MTNPTLLLAPLNGTLTAQDRNGATAFAMTSGDAGYYPGFGQGPFGGGGFGGVPATGLQLEPGESASIANANHVLPQSGALWFRFVRVLDSGAEEILGTIGTLNMGGDSLRWGITAADKLFVEWQSGYGDYQRLVSVESIALDTFYSVYFAWSDLVTWLSLANATPVTGTRDRPIGTFGAGAIVFAAPAGAQYAFGKFSTFDRLLTDTERDYLEDANALYLFNMFSALTQATLTGLDAPLYRGDDRQVTIAITDSDGDAVPLYGASVWFTGKSIPNLADADDANAEITCAVQLGNDGVPVSQSGYVDGDPAAGQVTFGFAVPFVANNPVQPSGTIRYTVTTPMQWDVQCKDVNGTVRTLASGRVDIASDVTRRETVV